MSVIDPSTPRPLAGAAVLVSGASGGIGVAVSRSLRAEGANLVLHGRDEAALLRLAEEVGGDVICKELSREPMAASHVVERAVEILGKLDAVVMAAGAGWAGELESMPAGRLEEIIALNLVAPLHLARAAAPELRRSPIGSLVFVASIAGHLGVRNEVAYSAAKGGLIAAAEGLAGELAPAKVSVVSPGAVKTAFFERRGRPYERSLPRPIVPERVAQAVVRCVREGQPELIVPRWLRVPVVVRSVSPSLYRRLASLLG